MIATANVGGTSGTTVTRTLTAVGSFPFLAIEVDIYKEYFRSYWFMRGHPVASDGRWKPFEAPSQNSTTNKELPVSIIIWCLCQRSITAFLLAMGCPLHFSWDLESAHEIPQIRTMRECSLPRYRWNTDFLFLDATTRILSIMTVLHIV